MKDLKIKGKVDVYLVERGLWIPAVSCSNMLLYSGYDILAKVLAGDPGYTVNGMYIQYYNGVPSAPVISKSRTPAYYTALTSPDGVCRVKTVADPSFKATSPSYSFNKAGFTAITDGSTLAGATIQDGVSNFYSIALAAIPDINDQSRDVLFSAANIVDGTGALAPILKVANSQVGFKWEITMED